MCVVTMRMPKRPRRTAAARPTSIPPNSTTSAPTPGELRNLVASKEHAATRADLEMQLASEGLTPDKDKMPLDEGIKSQLPDQKIR